MTTTACVPHPIAASVLRQIASACSYLTPAARGCLMEQAARQPRHGAAMGDAQAAVAAELARNPVQAAAHEASEL